MSVDTVFITKEVYTSCLHHAMSTEKEEVMGLLLGDIWGRAALIWAFIVQVRSDKRKDRVEVSPGQLVQAVSRAEELSKKMDKASRVIGWYHSHPHITCPPSHVDLRTQFGFQAMDQGFIGLIFSVYDAPRDPADKGYHHRSELRGFQAKEKRGETGLVEKILKVHIRPANYHIFKLSPVMQKDLQVWCISELVGMINKIFEEEKATYQRHLARYTSPLTRSQCRHIYQQALLRLTQDCLHPFISAFQYSLTWDKLVASLLPKASSGRHESGAGIPGKISQSSPKRQRVGKSCIRSPETNTSPPASISQSHTLSLSDTPKKKQSLSLSSPHYYSYNKSMKTVSRICASNASPRKSTSPTPDFHASPRKSNQQLEFLTREKSQIENFLSDEEMESAEESVYYPLSVDSRKNRTTLSPARQGSDAITVPVDMSDGLSSNNFTRDKNDPCFSSHNTNSKWIIDSKVDGISKVNDRPLSSSSINKEKINKRKKKKKNTVHNLSLTSSDKERHSPANTGSK